MEQTWSFNILISQGLKHSCLIDVFFVLLTIESVENDEGKKPVKFRC